MTKGFVAPEENAGEVSADFLDEKEKFMLRKLLLLIGVCTIIGGTQATAQVIITEFGSSTNVDWVELYNAGTTDVDIQNYQLDDLDGNKEPFTTSSCILPAGGYAIFYYTTGTDETGSDPDGTGNQNGYIDLYASASLADPNLSGDQQVLLDANGNAIDAVAWIDATFPTGEDADVDSLFTLSVWTDLGTAGADVGDVIDISGFTSGNTVARYLSNGTAKYEDNDDKNDWYESSGTLGADNDVTLPVSLSLFDARIAPGRITLFWRTESEVDNLGFEIFRRVGSFGEFQKLPVFIEGAGSTSRATEYTYEDLDVRPGGEYGYLLKSVDFAGRRETFGPLVVRLGNGEVTLVDGNVPQGFKLKGNYPNPFRRGATTAIDFSVPALDGQAGSTQPVTITIFDLLGRRVAVLLQNNLASGTYRVIWNGRNAAGDLMPAGVYFYQLRSADVSLIGRLTLVR